jgi:putative PIN family toxin of toxin-antitoxin system
MTTFILDTNVVASGLLTNDPASPPARMLDAVMNGDIRTLVSHELLAEYRAVLLRPAITARHGLDADAVDILLEEIALSCAVHNPASVHPDPPDPGDEHLWALMATDPGAVLVTGDRALIDAAPKAWRVLLPAEAVQEVER